MGFSMLLRRSGYLDLFVLLAGVSNPGLCFSLSLLDVSSLGVPLTIQSSACPDLSAPHFAVSQLDTFLLLQGCACFGSSFFASPVASFGFLLTASDSSNFGLLPLLRCKSQVGSACSTLDFAHFALITLLHHFAHADVLLLAPKTLLVDLPLPIQSVTCCDFFPLPLGLACVDFIHALPVPDFVHLETLSLTQSFSHLSFSPLAFDFMHVGLSSLMRDLSECSVLVPGLSRLDLLFAMLLTESAKFDPPFFPRGTGRLDLTLPAAFTAALDFLLFLHSLSYTELLSSLFKSLGTGLLLPTIDSESTGIASTVRKPFCTSLLFSVLDSTATGLPTSLQSLA